MIERKSDLFLSFILLNSSMDVVFVSIIFISNFHVNTSNMSHKL